LAIDTCPRIVYTEEYPPSPQMADQLDRLASIHEWAGEALAALLSGMPVLAWKLVIRIMEEAE
jgi:hypothetical protein